MLNSQQNNLCAISYGIATVCQYNNELEWSV